MRVGIVGAGPAGLTAALAARALGLAPTVFEQTRDFSRVGGGIALQPNGLCVVDALGLLDAFEPILYPVDQVVLQRADGHVLGRFEYRNLASPHRHVAILPRIELQRQLLAAAVRNDIPIHWERRCTGVALANHQAVLQFATGEDHACEVVVGADGVHSAVRTLLAFRTRLRALGWGALRGTVGIAPNASFIREIWGTDGRLFGIAPLSGARTYFYCTAPLGQWSAILEDGLEEWIEGWSSYGPEVLGILRAVTDWRAVNYDEIREVRVSRWYRLPAFLIGDAAHAMAPNWGQGANSAMVDALVLMQLLSRAPRDPGGLEGVGPRYEAVRRRFVGLVQTGSRIAAAMPGWASPSVRWLRDAFLGVQDRIPFSKRRSLALVAGQNPKERVFLERLRRPGGSPA